MFSISAMLIQGIHQADPAIQDRLRAEALKVIQVLYAAGVDPTKPIEDMTEQEKAIARQVVGNIID